MSGPAFGSPDPWVRWVKPCIVDVISALRVPLLCDHLVADDLLTLEQRRTVLSKPSDEEMARYLLYDILFRRPPKQDTFQRFCNVLRRIPEQRSILDLFEPHSNPVRESFSETSVSLDKGSVNIIAKPDGVTVHVSPSERAFSKAVLQISAERRDSPAQPITIPSLGKQIEIGQFYDARTNAFYDGLSAWTAEDVAKNQVITKCARTEFSFFSTNNERDKNAGLDVLGSVYLKLKLLTASGSAQYLNETKSHAHEACFGASCWVKTQERAMPMEQLMNLKYARDDVLKTPELTHFVQRVVEGGQAHLSLSHQCSNAEEEARVKSQLLESIKRLQVVALKFEGSLFADEMKEIIAKHQPCQISLFCDHRFPRPLVTLADAVDEASNFPQRLQGMTRTLTVHLLPVHYLPVDKLDSTALRVFQSLDELDLQNVSDLLDQLRQACLDLSYTNEKVVNKSWFPSIGEQVEGVERQIKAADIAFRNVCTTILPQLRALNDGSVQLKHRLRKAIKETQNSVKLASRFVEAKKREMQMVQAILKEAGDEVINDLASDKPFRAHCLSLSLAEANKREHPLQANLRFCAEQIISCISDAEKDTSKHSESDSSSEFDDDDDGDKRFEWFEDKRITKRIFRNIQHMKEAMQANREEEVSMEFRVGRIAMIEKPRKAPVLCGDVVVVDEKGSKSRAVFAGRPTEVNAREVKNESDQKRVVLKWRNECDLPLEGDKCRIRYWKICDDTERPCDSANVPVGMNVKWVDVPFETAADDYDYANYSVSLSNATIKDVEGCYCGFSVRVFSRLVGFSPRSEPTMLRTSRAPSIVFVKFYRTMAETNLAFSDIIRLIRDLRRQKSTSKGTRTIISSRALQSLLDDFETLESDHRRCWATLVYQFYIENVANASDDLLFFVKCEESEEEVPEGIRSKNEN